MRTAKGGLGRSVSDPTTREAIIRVEDTAAELADSIARISKGQLPIAGGGGGVIGVTDHGALTGLGDDDHTQYLLLAGRAGGQTIAGNDSATTVLGVNGASGQTGDLQQWRTNVGTVRAKVDKDGHLQVLAGSSSGPDGSTAIWATSASVGDALGIYPSNSSSATGLRFFYPFSSGSAATFIAVQEVGGGTTNIMNGRGRFLDSGFTLANVTTQSKLAQFDLSGITANTTRAFTLPDETGTIALKRLTTRGDLLTRNATAEVRLALGSAGTFLKSDGTDPSWVAPALTDLSGTAHLVYDNVSMSLDGVTWTVPLDSSSASILSFEGDHSLSPIIYQVYDTASTGFLGINLDTNIPAGAQSLTFPSTGGTVVTTSAAQTMGNKTLSTTTVLQTQNVSTGTRFQDTSVSGKHLRISLVNASANDHGLVFYNSGARQYAFRDYTADVVLVGSGTSGAGTLGSINLTGQTGDITAKTLLTSSANSSGMFRVSFYVVCTTGGTGGDKTAVTVAWNDGAAQSADVRFTQGVTSPANQDYADLATTNYASYGSCIVYAAASTAITFTTTGTYSGSPVYTLRARIEALG